MSSCVHSMGAGRKNLQGVQGVGVDELVESVREVVEGDVDGYGLVWPPELCRTLITTTSLTKCHVRSLKDSPSPLVRIE